MTIYTCKICSKTFERLSSYKKHTENRKSSCNANDNLNYTNLHNFTQKNTEISTILHNFTQKNQEIHKNSNNNNNNNNNDVIQHKKNINCMFCNKSYSRNDSLKRHLVNCKLKFELENTTENPQNREIEKIIQYVEILKNDNDELKNDNNELKTQLTELLAIIGKNGSQIHTNSHNTDNTNSNNTLNNTNNGNITNNTFHIEKIEFGKEDLAKLTDNFFINTLMNYYGAEIPNKIIENLHFNSKNTENMNVYITDSSRDKAMIYDGKEWKITTASEVVENLLDKAVIYCENKHDELREKIEKSEKHKKKINKEMDTMKIMTNYEPHDYNDDGQPIDVDGEVRPINEFKRGKKLNERAKQLITLTLQNKKNIILESEKKPKGKKYLKTG